MTPHIVRIHQAIAQKPQTSTQIAVALGLSKDCTVSQLQRLLKQGLIKRVANASKGYVYGVAN